MFVFEVRIRTAIGFNMIPQNTETYVKIRKKKHPMPYFFPILFLKGHGWLEQTVSGSGANLGYFSRKGEADFQTILSIFLFRSTKFIFRALPKD